MNTAAENYGPGEAVDHDYHIEEPRDGEHEITEVLIEYFQDVLDGAQAAVDRFSQSDALTCVSDGAGWEQIFNGTESRINMMANFATKYVFQKKSSNGQLWSERLAGVTTQTMHHAYTALESICLRDENRSPSLP